MLRWLVVFGLVIGVGATRAQAQAPPAQRPRVAIALGGGSARGIAHVGVLRWLEEHHIPIDAVAGSSMGGLIGGAYAAGMAPDDIETMLVAVDWDGVFGASGFRFDHLRRKRDLRDYSSRLEFGLKNGIAGPSALNNGQQVGLLLSRIAAAYYRTTNFDDLPTPFRCVALDLKTAKPVVIGSGSLARAMRATMSMPLTFPPVIDGDRILVDGGTLNQIPTDIARNMGATTVIGVNVGELGTKMRLDYSLLGLVAETMDAMIRANAAANLAKADVAISVPLEDYRTTDWQRTPELIRAGYAAAERVKDQLLPLAVDEAQWTAWRSRRRAATIASLPAPAFVRVDGAGKSDTARMERRLAIHRDTVLDVAAIELSLNELGGLDRFETVTWALATEGAKDGLVFTALPKTNGPPFLFLGVSLENTTSNEFRLGVGARMLAFDVLASGAELRVDAAVGSEPAIGATWHLPIASTPLFIEPMAKIGTTRISIIEDEQIVAEYGRRRAETGVDIGLNPGRLSEVRLGARIGRTDANVRLGDPGLPELEGTEAALHATWIYDGQDDPLLPSRGAHLVSTVTHLLRASQPVAVTSDRSSEGVTKAEASMSWFHPVAGNRGRRLFAIAGAGTTFSGRPLVIDQFAIGGPMRLTTFGIGEARGDRYGYAGAGYLQRLMRLPDFLGRSVFAGGWLESGTAFDRGSDADITVHASIGLIADTLIGPIFAGTSATAGGHSRWYVGVGHIFP